ncbi:hypothetical protein [Candidatus Viadribacter manganicus]|uniref:EAL domain-containing protein n=1 Tax=Candidatus Viadribacter manganicus TaxID=1759059 RepID=A0A1B1AMH1_9PROT|nr:hypothetical protein [Candidatus Viadribacter manganicus]ANP47756.1 hypothetical protein ATE48_18570 [Candidatus Viadribacter manganicus]
MNVIPFRPRPQSEPLAFAIGARVDLRVGALAGGVIRPFGQPEEAFQYSNLSRLVRGARMAWLERSAPAVLTLAVPHEIQSTLEADMLSEAAIEAGCTRRNFNFQLNERELVKAGAGLAEELRARGWNVVLRGDPECPLPFGARARNLYCELVLQPPPTPDPFLAMDEGDRSPLGRRLLAAKAAGLTITAESVLTASLARTLAIAGFERGGGPFAEAALR